MKEMNPFYNTLRYIEMRNLIKIKSMMLAALAMVFVWEAQAQFDDLYYDPSKDVAAIRTSRNVSATAGADRGYENFDRYESSYDNNYDAEEYGFYDDVSMGYASRINRFHRVNPGFGFYDPFFYDPFLTHSFLTRS
jgi:hypothetical protein